MRVRGKSVSDGVRVGEGRCRGGAAGVALPLALGEGHVVGEVSPGVRSPPGLTVVQSMYREKDSGERSQVMPADHRDADSKGRPPPPPPPPKVIPSVTVTSDSYSSQQGDPDDSDYQDNPDHPDFRSDYQDQLNYQDQQLDYPDQQSDYQDQQSDYQDQQSDYQDQSDYKDRSDLQDRSERPDGLSEQLSEKLSALLIKQLSGGQESGVECECGALEEWSSGTASASMADDEVLFDEVYDVHEVIGK